MLAPRADLFVVIQEARKYDWHDHETPSAGRPAWGYSFFAGRTAAGKRIQITKSGFESRKEAGQALHLAIQEHRPGPAPAGRTDFGGFINRWLEEQAKHRCTPKTFERYTQLGRYALRYLSNVDLESITPVSIESALNALRNSGGRKDEMNPLGRPLSARTVRHVAFLVHDSLEAAVRWGTLSSNPMDRVILPKPERKEPKVLDEQGLRRFLDAVRGTSQFPLLVTAVSTGCRRGELLALEWPDIDFQTGMITISKSLEQTKNGLNQGHEIGRVEAFPIAFGGPRCSYGAPPEPTEWESY